MSMFRKKVEVMAMDTVDTVDMVDMVDTVDTVDMVDMESSRNIATAVETMDIITVNLKLMKVKWIFSMKMKMKIIAS